MLGVWISCASWQPTVDDVCDLLSSVFRVVRVQCSVVECSVVECSAGVVVVVVVM